MTWTMENIHIQLIIFLGGGSKLKKNMKLTNIKLYTEAPESDLNPKTALTNNFHFFFFNSYVQKQY